MTYVYSPGAQSLLTSVQGMLLVCATYVPCNMTEICCCLLKLLQNLRPENGPSDVLCLGLPQNLLYRTAFRRFMFFIMDCKILHEQHGCASLVCACIAVPALLAPVLCGISCHVNLMYMCTVVLIRTALK